MQRCPGGQTADDGGVWGGGKLAGSCNFICSAGIQGFCKDSLEIDEEEGFTGKFNQCRGKSLSGREGELASQKRIE